MRKLDFSGGPLVKNLLANAGDTASIHGPGRPHMPWGNYAHVPQLLSLYPWTCAPQKKPHSEKRTHHN